MQAKITVHITLCCILKNELKQLIASYSQELVKFQNCMEDLKLTGAQ